MTIPIPLAVRLVTHQADRHVTRDLRDLRFRETAVGGWASATLSLDRPLIFDPVDVDYYAKVYVYDIRTGQTVWEGRLEDPGRSAGADGQVWSLTAMGPAAHAQDRTVPLIYVDRDLGNWIDYERFASAGGYATNVTVDAASLPVTPTVRFQWGAGADLVSQSRVARAYPLLRASGQRMARYDYTWVAGRTNSLLRVQSVTRDSGGGSGGRDEPFVTTGSAGSGQTITVNYANTRDWLDIRILWNSTAVTVADEVTWAELQPYIVATRFATDGTEILDGALYSAGTVIASSIVQDLLGRLLPQYDGPNAAIDATSYAIDQLAYPGGVNADGVLADLMTFEPGFRWGAYESNTSGKHRFEWSQWPTTVRYEADVTDGFDSPQSTAELFNAVQVRWTDVNDLPQLTRRTSTVAELAAAGLTREALIDLGSEVGSKANAERAGDQFLAEHGSPPNAGKLTVARPIRDINTGRMVMPWEIKAGELIRVRGVLPRVDSLNATARDGATVFRVWSKEYSASAASAVLELDSYSLSTARALSDLRAGLARRR